MRAELVAVALLAASVARAQADDEPHATHTAAPSGKHEATDPRTQLAEQLASETEILAKTRATVAGKLSAVDAARAARLRAIARVLNDPIEADATADDRMAAARRRAAARLLLAHDASEHALLADEAAHLQIADVHTTEATIQLPSVTIPENLAWPAHGTIARHFGAFTHERSKATLSRRGVDLEVDDRASAVAPAAGTVRYAGTIRGLDRGVIIDHGDFITVIAKLGELALPVGTKVDKGDRVGRAARHRVYFEVRVKLGPGGLPIDPESVFAKPPKR